MQDNGSVGGHVDSQASENAESTWRTNSHKVNAYSSFVDEDGGAAWYDQNCPHGLRHAWSEDAAVGGQRQRLDGDGGAEGLLDGLSLHGSQGMSGIEFVDMAMAELVHRNRQLKLQLTEVSFGTMCSSLIVLTTTRYACYSR